MIASIKELTKVMQHLKDLSFKVKLSKMQVFHQMVWFELVVLWTIRIIISELENKQHTYIYLILTDLTMQITKQLR